MKNTLFCIAMAACLTVGTSVMAHTAMTKHHTSTEKMTKGEGRVLFVNSQLPTTKFDIHKSWILLAPSTTKSGCSVAIKGSWYKPVASLRKYDLNHKGYLTSKDLKNKVMLARYNSSGKLTLTTPQGMVRKIDVKTHKVTFINQKGMSRVQAVSFCPANRTTSKMM